MANSAYFLRQAERCLRLSRECNDTVVAERLQIMAAEFHQRAEQAAHPLFVPPKADDSDEISR